jgi:hypothetical protein
MDLGKALEELYNRKKEVGVSLLLIMLPLETAH